MQSIKLLLPSRFKVLPERPQAANPVRLAEDLSISELYKRLNKHKKLRGRFIVLPNVNNGGDYTLLRPGFAQKYTEMPCVGGYVDALASEKANFNITNGLDPNWGESDSRNSDFRCSGNDFQQLGRALTWIKWSSPTAEALRQACLARQSRIKHDRPGLPTRYIAKLKNRFHIHGPHRPRTQPANERAHRG